MSASSVALGPVHREPAYLGALGPLELVLEVRVDEPPLSLVRGTTLRRIEPELFDRIGVEPVQSPLLRAASQTGEGRARQVAAVGRRPASRFFLVPLCRRASVWRAGRAPRVSNYLARQLVVG